jgi:hypothetical protein
MRCPGSAVTCLWTNAGESDSPENEALCGVAVAETGDDELPVWIEAEQAGHSAAVQVLVPPPDDAQACGDHAGACSRWASGGEEPAEAAFGPELGWHGRPPRNAAG